MAKAGRGADQYMVRFPEGLRERIKEAAEANGRSMNSEIVSALEDAYPDPSLDGVTWESLNIDPDGMKEVLQIIRAAFADMEQTVKDRYRHGTSSKAKRSLAVDKGEDD